MRLSGSFRSPSTRIRPRESFREHVLAKRRRDAMGDQMEKKEIDGRTWLIGDTVFHLNVNLMRTLHACQEKSTA